MELTFKDLTKRYGRKRAVDRLNVTLTHGVYGLLGPNGSGKTTLMRMMTGLLKPTSGQVLYNGQEIAKMGDAYRAKLGFLPQEFGFYRGFTGNDMLRYIAALKGLDEKKTEKEVKRLSEMVGLSSDEMGRLVSGYSGGMRRRLGIAQALMDDPEILVLDEPTAGLDPQERVRFRNLISGISSSRLVLLSTHIISDIEFIAGDVLILRKGKLLLQAPPAEIIASVKGKVWTVEVPPEEVERFQKTCLIGNLRQTGTGVELRVVGDEAPAPAAVPAEPTLEDVYLYYFREASSQ